MAERKPLATLKPGLALANLSPVRTPSVGKWGDPRRGSRHERGYGTEWDKLRATILKRDRYLCQCEECREANRIRPANEVDHIVCKALGGDDNPSNLRAISHDCHVRKTARDRIEVMRLTGG